MRPSLLMPLWSDAIIFVEYLTIYFSLEFDLFVNRATFVSSLRALATPAANAYYCTVPFLFSEHYKDGKVVQFSQSVMNRLVHQKWFHILPS